MIRFFEVIFKNQQGNRERKLNLSDIGLGDHSVVVVCKILKNNEQFSQLVTFMVHFIIYLRT
jgi:hypothetical protein